jgi:hypothetical protein
MSDDRDYAHRDAAIQYLAWAVEEIEKSGNEVAARQARAALKSLEKTTPSQDRRAVGSGDPL